MRPGSDEAPAHSLRFPLDSSLGLSFISLIQAQARSPAKNDFWAVMVALPVSIRLSNSSRAPTAFLNPATLRLPDECLSGHTTYVTTITDNDLENSIIFGRFTEQGAVKVEPRHPPSVRSDDPFCQPIRSDENLINLNGSSPFQEATLMSDETSGALQTDPPPRGASRLGP